MWDQVQTYFWPWAALIGLSLALVWACKRHPFWGKRLLGILFLLGGLANLFLAIFDPRDYLVFGRFTFFSFYRWFIYMILFRQALWMGTLLALVHLYIAYHFLKGGPLSTLSVVMAIALLLLLAPLGFGSAFPATVFLMAGVYYVKVSMDLETGS